MRVPLRSSMRGGRLPGRTTFLPIRFRPSIRLRGLPGWRGLTGDCGRVHAAAWGVGQEVNPMLKTGYFVPHFTVTTSSSGSASPTPTSGSEKTSCWSCCRTRSRRPRTTFVSQLTAQLSDLTADDSACVITRDSVSGVPCPASWSADRWGEIHHARRRKTSTIYPSRRRGRMASLRAASVPRVRRRGEIRCHALRSASHRRSLFRHVTSEFFRSVERGPKRIPPSSFTLTHAVSF